MHHFAAQLLPAQQSTHSLRADQYRRRPKRKRDEDDEDADEKLDTDTQGPSPPPAHLHTQIQASLAELEPPLFTVNAPRTRPDGDTSALRQAHLTALTAILHRCLLEGDYPRAGRAWGLILRTQIASVPIDPRNHTRWGIGAELLLQKSTAGNDDDALPNEIYSAKGFELAREYYEHLIVQHPNKKWVPRAIDELTFYPAMFSLWIYETCEKSKRARQQPDETSQLSDGDTSMDDARVRNTAIVAEELQQARQIASRMDQLIVSPPFDKHADVLQLRGMVGLWLADLVLGKGTGREINGWATTMDNDDSEMHESQSEKLQKYVESRRELSRAQEIFRRAQVNGRRVAGGILERVDSRIEDLSKEISAIGEK